MKRAWLGAISLVLFVLIGGSAQAAVVPEVQSETLSDSPKVTKTRPPEEARVQLSALQGQSAQPSGGSVSSASPSNFFSDGFESPATSFAVFGNGWATTPYRKSEGARSAYCAGMYTPPPGPYPPLMDSWLIAGPFDLSDYASATISFDLWADCEPGGDSLGVGASTGDVFDLAEYVTTGGEWRRQTVDISQYSGQSEVWIAFVFSSDDLGESEGVYIDGVSLSGAPLTSALKPVFRFYNVANGTHFYTPSAEERDNVIATLSKTYNYDGIAYWTSALNNSSPLYRFYNRRSGGHFYTASSDEAARVHTTWPDIFAFEGCTYAVNPWAVPDSIPAASSTDRTEPTSILRLPKSEIW